MTADEAQIQWLKQKIREQAEEIERLRGELEQAQENNRAAIECAQSWAKRAEQAERKVAASIDRHVTLPQTEWLCMQGAGYCTHPQCRPKEG